MGFSLVRDLPPRDRRRGARWAI